MAISSLFDRSRQPSRTDVHVDFLYDTKDASINKTPAEVLALLPKVAIDSDTVVIQRQNADSTGPNAVFRDPATAPTTLITTDAYEFALDADEYPPIAYRLGELNSAWAAAGSALNNLARLRSMVTALDGRETAHMGFVMNWSGWRSVQAAYVAAGMEPQMMRCRDGEIRLSYLGVPIYINEFIASAQTTTSVYAVLAHPGRGCFIAVNRNCMEPKIYPVNMDESPYKSFVAEWNVQLVSTTDRALARNSDSRPPLSSLRSTPPRIGAPHARPHQHRYHPPRRRLPLPHLRDQQHVRAVSMRLGRRTGSLMPSM